MALNKFNTDANVCRTSVEHLQCPSKKKKKKKHF